jgi:sister-chromatid-cohesion protein PDS5
MSDLAQELIKGRCQLHSWSLQSYPGKIKLPSDILRALPSAESANKVGSCHLFIPHIWLLTPLHRS